MGQAMTTTEARDAFADIVNRVAYTGERVVLHRRGKPLVALVPLQDVAALEAMEDRSDVAAARRALREPGSKAWSEVKKDLGLEEPKTKKPRQRRRAAVA